MLWPSLFGSPVLRATVSVGGMANITSATAGWCRKTHPAWGRRRNPGPPLASDLGLELAAPPLRCATTSIALAGRSTDNLKSSFHYRDGLSNRLRTALVARVTPVDPRQHHGCVDPIAILQRHIHQRVQQRVG